jgi:hypothetical protein
MLLSTESLADSSGTNVDLELFMRVQYIVEAVELLGLPQRCLYKASVASSSSTRGSIEPELPARRLELSLSLLDLSFCCCSPSPLGAIFFVPVPLSMIGDNAIEEDERLAISKVMFERLGTADFLAPLARSFSQKVFVASCSSIRDGPELLELPVNVLALSICSLDSSSSSLLGDIFSVSSPLLTLGDKASSATKLLEDMILGLLGLISLSYRLLLAHNR